ncbi:hypothetical protein GGR56DRAFT_688556 [Xylariaceae sp. FL0804]|nr:hypothetical protein GGR56DRAFT_688556 [Xylariaceae sp. FL0804]
MQITMDMMSGQEPAPDWAAIADPHWQIMRATWEREDAAMHHEHAVRQDQLRHRLVEMYDRKSHLQNELRAIETSIHYQETEQERLAREYEDRRDRLRLKRQEEERIEQDRILRARENNAAAARKEHDGRPSSNGRISARVLPVPAAAGGWTSINGSRRRGRRAEEEEPPADPGNLLSSIYHNPVNETVSPTLRAIPLRSNVNLANGGSPEADGVAADANGLNRVRDRPLKPKQGRHSLPGFSSLVQAANGRSPVPATPPVPKPKSPRGRKSLPTAKAPGSVASESPAPEISTSDGQEITRDKLVMKDDGYVLTEPALFAGVPLEKIDEKHPYWNPEWESLESHIQPQLTKWKEKLEELRRNTDSIRHTVFLANRQVNRGQTIMDFLKENTTFHPYQFVCKEITDKFYKTFVNYDTVFRLANVHEELKKFDLEVTPLQWLRQRMYEIAEAQGDKFSLSKTTHDLYHDPKLKALREKHGFGNIGRPSGYKVGEKDPNKVSKRTKRESAAGSSRRKGRRSIGQMDADNGHAGAQGSPSQAAQAGQKGPQMTPTEYLEPVTPRLQKRQRLEAAYPRMAEEEAKQAQLPDKADKAGEMDEKETGELEYDGYTTTDSFSAGRIMHLDWRVYQIKTRALTTSTEVTQYWTWKREKNTFEHQVLRDVQPKVIWGFYQKPINFDLALTEIRELRWSPDSQKIEVLTTDESRGHVLAYFKRQRTKVRFLSFVRKKGVRLTKVSGAQLEDGWDGMESSTLPDESSEGQ